MTKRQVTAPRHRWGSLDNESVIDDFWFGLSKRFWQFA